MLYLEFLVFSMIPFQGMGFKAWQLSHVVDNSWLPLSMSVISFLFMSSVVMWFKFGFSVLSYSAPLIMTVFILIMWFRDLNRESGYQGHHTLLVQGGLKWGLIWFLFSEIWFFFSVFWTFFHVSLSPLTSGILTWPNLGLEPIPAFQVPLLNTVILLMSGVTATLAHQEILKGTQSAWVFISSALGLYFLTLQAMEYYMASFSISSGVFGSVFFFGTGFHGLHVCLGMIMLLVSSMRLKLNLMSGQHHFSLEFSLWYWHFVDVVWLFLFFWVYTWGGCVLIDKL